LRAALVVVGVAIGGTRAWLAESATAVLLVALCAAQAANSDSNIDGADAGAAPLEARSA
jgi:esterase/lipase